MKITFSGTPEEIAAAIRAVAGVGEVQIRVAEPAWRKMAEEVAQEMRGLAEKIEPAPAAADPTGSDDFITHGEDTERTIKREDVRLEVGDIVHHRDGKILAIYRDYGDCDLPFETDEWFVGRNGTCGNQLGVVTHFRRNGITYTIED